MILEALLKEKPPVFVLSIQGTAGGLGDVGKKKPGCLENPALWLP
jgi:hypothetical protein